MRIKLQVLIYDVVEMKRFSCDFFAETDFISGYANGFGDKTIP